MGRGWDIQDLVVRLEVAWNQHRQRVLSVPIRVRIPSTDTRKKDESCIHKRPPFDCPQAKHLAQDFGHDVSVYIGQTVMSSLELEGQLFMVDAQKMQDGRM